MEPIKLNATKRTGSGKGKARRLRASGRIPAIAYGKDLESLSLAVTPKDLLEILEGDYGRNSLIELDIEGGDKIKVLLSDFQYHPVSRDLLHADFLQIKDDVPVDVEVPLELTGRAKGVVLGGILRQVYRELPLRCLPKDIPVKIAYDVTELELDSTVSVKDLSLPEGVTVRLGPERTVVALVGEKRRGEEEAEGEAVAAPEAAAEAPAKG